jgi:excisionase family DNA binding protein
MNTTFLTARDIAAIFKISRGLAHRLIAQGQIPSIRFGRVSRVRQEDLDTFIQKCMRKPDTNGTMETDINTSLLGKGDDKQAI